MSGPHQEKGTKHQHPLPPEHSEGQPLRLTQENHNQLAQTLTDLATLAASDLNSRSFSLERLRLSYSAVSYARQLHDANAPDDTGTIKLINRTFHAVLEVLRGIAIINLAGHVNKEAFALAYIVAHELASFYPINRFSSQPNQSICRIIESLRSFHTDIIYRSDISSSADIITLRSWGFKGCRRAQNATKLKLVPLENELKLLEYQSKNAVQLLNSPPQALALLAAPDDNHDKDSAAYKLALKLVLGNFIDASDSLLMRGFYYPAAKSLDHVAHFLGRFDQHQQTLWIERYSRICDRLEGLGEFDAAAVLLERLERSVRYCSTDYQVLALRLGAQRVSISVRALSQELIDDPRSYEERADAAISQFQLGFQKLEVQRQKFLVDEALSVHQAAIGRLLDKAVKAAKLEIELMLLDSPPAYQFLEQAEDQLNEMLKLQDSASHISKYRIVESLITIARDFIARPGFAYKGQGFLLMAERLLDSLLLAGQDISLDFEQWQQELIRSTDCHISLVATLLSQDDQPQIQSLNKHIEGLEKSLKTIDRVREQTCPLEFEATFTPTLVNGLLVLADLYGKTPDSSAEQLGALIQAIDLIRIAPQHFDRETYKERLEEAIDLARDQQDYDLERTLTEYLEKL
ncbi:MAG: hypothetical protein ACK5HO_05620 [Pseudomonadota bacterium]